MLQAMVNTKESVQFQKLQRELCCTTSRRKQIPEKLQPDFANDAYMQSYLWLFANSNLYYENADNGITPTDFKNGNTLFWFDLSPQMDCSKHALELIKSGNLRIDLRFDQALPHTISVVCYSEFDNLLEIDRGRGVSLDYSA